MRIPVFKSAKTKAQNSCAVISAFIFGTQKVQFLFFVCYVYFDLTVIKYLPVVNQDYQTSNHKKAYFSTVPRQSARILSKLVGTPEVIFSHDATHYIRTLSKIISNAI